jgi:hypothetical protein
MKRGKAAMNCGKKMAVQVLRARRIRLRHILAHLRMVASSTSGNCTAQGELCIHSMNFSALNGLLM